ncbi:hypothetical protein JCM10213_004904 [Rhodosporidiobolus nylandii]
MAASYVYTKLRHRPALAFAALAVVSLFVLFSLRSADLDTPGPLAPTAQRKHANAAAHPNFDFDAHLQSHPEQHAALEHADDEEDGDAEGESAHEDSEAGEIDEDAAAAEDDGETGEEPAGTAAHPALAGEKTSLARPFLPFTCEPCASQSLAPFSPTSPTCAKYRSPPASSRPANPLHPAILDHAVLFPGTGDEVRRVLRRAMKSSLLGAKRAREGTEEDMKKLEDEEPFRVLVLGGSVSNCRGVDHNTACWHSHILRWFQRSFPMEGDGDLSPGVPSLLYTPPAAGPLRLDDARQRAKRDALAPFLDPTADSQLAQAATSSPSQPAPPSTSPPPPARLAKRAAAAKKKKKKKPKKVKAGSGGRRRPSTKLINGSKSATGSAFFAYCFEEEMTLRRKNIDWGLGPDLIIVESGVNDVWPGGEQATKDFEKLLRRLRSMPSKPAVIALEAASLLLASTTAATANAEYDHLPAAHFYDVPVLSVKHALFGPTAGLLPSSSTSAQPLKVEDLFLPDLHHPNERGHELLADVLVSYLEQQACLAQSEVLAVASERIRSSSSLTSADSASGVPLPLVTVSGANEVDPVLDFARRKDEVVRPLPARSLFTPFPHGKGARLDEVWELPETRCIQVGNAKTTVEPVRNSGWSKLAWARDKQYLVADKPGSSVTYAIEVGKGGAVYADWLHSRFYDLGDVSVFLDNDRAAAVSLAGWWNLGWSIGVPQEIFSNVSPGRHEITFEILPPAKSSHPSQKTNFRLIGITST